uniref:Uncharacterized protein n=1 Tax=Ophidocladus simpliciusculus TaxID=1261574 RepID=A0A1Z1MIX9_9FLOR|nr:hypothetical protein [Ophidocladus simpliciusculus]ARW65906.1 hypothetical protein [Ophidocladus simpliciusculus]
MLYLNYYSNTLGAKSFINITMIYILQYRIKNKL